MIRTLTYDLNDAAPWLRWSFHEDAFQVDAWTGVSRKSDKILLAVFWVPETGDYRVHNNLSNPNRYYHNQTDPLSKIKQIVHEIEFQPISREIAVPLGWKPTPASSVDYSFLRRDLVEQEARYVDLLDKVRKSLASIPV